MAEHDEPPFADAVWATKALRELVAPQYPKILDKGAPPLKIVSTALVSRITAITDAVVAVSALRRRSDLAALMRNLYEHVVVFGWLLAEPTDERLAIWQRYDNEQRTKSHNDMKATGRDLLTPENLALSKLQVKSLGDRSMPNLAQCAEEADKYWGSRLPGFEPANPMKSFRGLYRTIYRMGSAFTHPSLLGLNPVVHDTPEHTVIVIESQVDSGSSLLMVPSMYGFALWMMGEYAGWPAATDVAGVFDQLKERRHSRPQG